MDWTTTRIASNELSASLVIGKPCVLIVEGREHNIIVEKVSDVYVVGRVALNKFVVLVDRPGRGTVVKLINPEEEMSAAGPGDELLLSEPCVVCSNPRIRVKIGSVDVFEDPWRPFLPNIALLPDGSINPDMLCEIIPEFSKYRVAGAGFSGSPEAWAKIELSPPQFSKDADDSSSEE